MATGWSKNPLDFLIGSEQILECIPKEIEIMIVNSSNPIEVECEVERINSIIDQAVSHIKKDVIAESLIQNHKNEFRKIIYQNNNVSNNDT